MDRALSGIDINRVNMDEDEFYEFAKWTPEDVPTEERDTELEEAEPETEEQPQKEEGDTIIAYPHKGFLRVGYSALRLRSTPTTSRNNNVIGVIRSGFTFTVHKEIQNGDNLWWLVELPNHTVGWGARRIQGVNFLEYAI
jgi:hypothetical protein